MVYDATYRESFESAKRWISDLKENTNVPDLLIALVGNKSDLTDRMEISLQEAHIFSKAV